MKRDNFLLVCVYSASDLNDEARYAVKVGVFHLLYLRSPAWNTISGHLGLIKRTVLCGKRACSSLFLFQSFQLKTQSNFLCTIIRVALESISMCFVSNSLDA